jgi:hypothetical protein
MIWAGMHLPLQSTSTRTAWLSYHMISSNIRAYTVTLAKHDNSHQTNARQVGALDPQMHSTQHTTCQTSAPTTWSDNLRKLTLPSAHHNPGSSTSRTLHMHHSTCTASIKACATQAQETIYRQTLPASYGYSARLCTTLSCCDCCCYTQHPSLSPAICTMYVTLPPPGLVCSRHQLSTTFAPCYAGRCCCANSIHAVKAERIHNLTPLLCPALYRRHPLQ